MIDPDDFDFNGQQESGLSCDSFEAGCLCVVVCVVVPLWVWLDELRN